MTIKIFSQDKAGLVTPSGNSPDIRTADNWQQVNKNWWEANPNRYDFDFKGKIPFEEYSKEFFKEIDKRFFDSVWRIMPWEKIPFDNLIEYEGLNNKRVLEIGIGCGSNSQYLAEYASDYTGIDLTEYGTNCTRKRLSSLTLPGKVLQMDAERLEFEDNSFDFIWSWGVIHHSSNTENIVNEISRVLSPGGKLVTMVYHQSFWNTYIRGALFYGILKGWFFKKRSLHSIIQDSTDGALARYYTLDEWRDVLSPNFELKEIIVLGSKSQLIPLPTCSLKHFLMKLIPNWLGRFITNRPSFGFLLVSTAVKK